MTRYGREGFKPDDVIITNHQAVAGQHLNNVVIYMPYFFEGELLMFSIVRAHWIDIGGMSTGFGGEARILDPWMEGLQLDQLKIYEAGKPNESLLKVIRDNIRFPDASLGDMRSQMAACRLAFRRLDELFEKFGRDTICSAIQRIFAETEMKCRKVVSADTGRSVRGRVVSGQRWNAAQRASAHSRAASRLLSGEMTIDLSGCSPERKAGINSRTLAGARVAYKALTSPLDPSNEGAFSALRGNHSRGEYHDGALSRADVRLEPHRADGRRHDSYRARSGNSRQNSGRASRACSAAPSYSSV